MQPIYSWAWTEEHAARTANAWNACSPRAPETAERFTTSEQQKREKAYDQGLQAVERAIKTAPVTSADRLATQDRITAACLAQCCLSAEENLFAFEWGVLLQLGDDLQDLRDDLRRNSVTLFSRAATLGQPLDSLAIQLLNFGAQVGSRMDRLPNGTTSLKDLLKMSWRSLIVRAVADSHEFFTPAFIREAEQWSPFRFEFLRTRHDKLANRQGLYAMLFDAFLESEECDSDSLLLMR